MSRYNGAYPNPDPAEKEAIEEAKADAAFHDLLKENMANVDNLQAFFSECEPEDIEKLAYYFREFRYQSAWALILEMIENFSMPTDAQVQDRLKET